MLQQRDHGDTVESGILEINRTKISDIYVDIELARFIGKVIGYFNTHAPEIAVKEPLNK